MRKHATKLVFVGLLALLLMILPLLTAACGGDEEEEKTTILLEADLAVLGSGESPDDALETVIDIIERRLDDYGLQEAAVRYEKERT